MQSLLLVGLGGFLGAVARHAMAGWVHHLAGSDRFPWGTLAVNVVGCLAVGLLAGIAERYHVIGPEARLFLLAGVLGGFTTFSAFGLDAVQLIRRGEVATAAVYAGASVTMAVLAVWLGFKVIAVLR